MKYVLLTTLITSIVTAHAESSSVQHTTIPVNLIHQVNQSQPARVNSPSFPASQQYNRYYYRQPFYRAYPAQYPLFYYLPETKAVEIDSSDESPVIELTSINDILDKKSEQAIKQNHLNMIEQETLSRMPMQIKNEVKLSGSDLSGLTTSSLISLARKKQQLEVLIPGLLSNQRLYIQDREKLEQLSVELQSSHKLNSEDELWLHKLSEDYQLPGRPLNDPRIDNGNQSTDQTRHHFF